MDVVMAGFLAVVGFVVVAAVAAVERIPAEVRAEGGWITRHPRLAAAIWLVISAAPTLAGLLAPAGPVPPQLLLIPILLGGMWLALSALGGAITTAVPLFALTGFQAFRFPLEVILHEWGQAGVVPNQLTWSGSNIDVVAGIVALVTIPVVRRWPRAGWLPTVVGIVLLANVLRVVVTSLPGPLQRFDDVILLPTMFPHVWIATVCVAAAVVGHVIAVRALLALK